MNFEKWRAKWCKQNERDVDVILKKHEAWVNENNITHTPTFFVNGKKLPGRYGLKELEILLPKLANEFAFK